MSRKLLSWVLIFLWIEGNYNFLAFFFKIKIWEVLSFQRHAYMKGFEQNLKRSCILSSRKKTFKKRFFKSINLVKYF